MFQCLLEGGLRGIATLGPCHMLGGSFSGSCSSMGVAYPLRGKGKRSDKLAPPQVAGSTQYGA